MTKDHRRTDAQIAQGVLLDEPDFLRTNGLERLNQETKRRTRVVRIFPNPQACLRSVTALCVEQSEDRVTGRRYLDSWTNSRNDVTRCGSLRG